MKRFRLVKMLSSLWRCWSALWKCWSTLWRGFSSLWRGWSSLWRGCPTCEGVVLFVKRLSSLWGDVLLVKRLSSLWRDFRFNWVHLKTLDSKTSITPAPPYCQQGRISHNALLEISRSPRFEALRVKTKTLLTLFHTEKFTFTPKFEAKR